jgi:general nucleoside transport system permease protein
MSPEYIIAAIVTIVGLATPILLAGLGELIAEKSGVLNLGVEGMMLVGAMSAFAVGLMTGSHTLAFGAAAIAGIGMALLFAFLTLSLQTNQVATGLALTLFGVGLSAFGGRDFVGMPLEGLKPLTIPILTQMPIVGPLLFHYDIIVYLSLVLFGAVQWFLTRTRAGLKMRAVGESPSVAHAIGHPVIGIRYLAVMFGGATAGIAGAYMSTALTPMWVEGMTAGRGWIALALVVFATWKPLRVLLGAYLFGGVTVMQLYAQGFGFSIPSEFLSMLPYLATIIVLVIICRDPKTILLNQPASLGRPFHPDA